MKHLVSVVDWYGPYSLEDAITVCKTDFAAGLYMCIGMRKGQRGDARLQYIGIAGSDIATRLCDPNHEIHKVTRDQKIWLGEINSLGVAGKKSKYTDPSQDFAEWAMIYFLGTELNKKKAMTPPRRPVTVLNRWWRKDYVTPWIHRPHKEWPDLIDYLGPEIKAKVVWFNRPRRVDVSLG